MHHTIRSKLINALLGLLLTILGILFLFQPMRQLRLSMYILTTVLFVIGLISLVSAIRQSMRTERAIHEWTWAAIDMGAVIALIVIGPRDIADLLPKLSAIWILLSGIMKLVIAIQSKKSGMQFWYFTLLSGLLFLALGALTILNGFTRTVMVGVMLGTVFCTAGVTMILELFVPGFEAQRKPGSKLLLARAFRPNAALKLLRKLSITEPHAAQTGDVPKCEILVHLADSRFDILFGHVDISVDGRIYSFGNYDSTSGRLLNSISDGLLIDAPRQAYVDYAIHEERKLLIGYEIALTTEQMSKLHAYFLDFIDQSTRFTPAFLDDQQTSDPASRMQTHIGCVCYKPRIRSFRTYFFVGTNCVRMVDEAIAATGRSRHHVSGVLMPGDYLSMLEREYKKRDGFVVGRRVYGLDQLEMESKTEHVLAM